MAARHVHRARDVTLVPLLVLAHVDEERRVVALVELARGRGVDLVDLGLHLVEYFAVGSHCYWKYSVAGAAPVVAYGL